MWGMILAMRGMMILAMRAIMVPVMIVLHRRSRGAPTAQTRGAVIRWPRTYDLILWVFTRGREQELRQTIADKDL
jgi:hypothetical protein